MHCTNRHWITIMVAVVSVLLAALTVGLVFGLGGNDDLGSVRTFTIDHNANTFLMDGKPFRYVAGSFHYFRALPEVWQDRLKNMRAAGLNAIDTYIEWSLHNPLDGVYNWDGIANVDRFMELVATEGFYVILRPGPYICAERDNGGLPHWLFTKYPHIRPRTNDANYTAEVATWYAQLMTRLQRHLYGNGGPIIMVQIENEYGDFYACDRDYLHWLRDETEKWIKGNALLFTTDIPDQRIECGKIDGVFATTDFGLEKMHEIDEVWKRLRAIQPTGPLVNSEFYPGWLTHWQEENQRRDPKMVADALRKIFSYKANVNFYMFFGGTNFGFTAGANDWGYGNYTADITSYDYDAVMDEAGDPTEKYRLVREIIADYLNVTNLPEPLEPTSRLAYGKVQMKPIMTLLSSEGRNTLANGLPITARGPLSFEELNQNSGLVLYETMLPKLQLDPTLLTLNGLRDRALVYVDEQFVGTLSRENRIYSVPLNKGWGNRLQMIVENQGRINFNIATDTKGIFGNVTIQQLDGKHVTLDNWNSTSFPLNAESIEKFLATIHAANKVEERVISESRNTKSGILLNGPTIYYGEFIISKFGDTYLNTTGWGKGIAYLNGFNLGRYWPLVGPQITLYVPRPLLKLGANTLVLLEYQRVHITDDIGTVTVEFVDQPQLDGR